MRRIVLTFGLISGVILSAMMVVTLPFQESLAGNRGMIVGYATMVAASLLIYFGVRRYRDEVGGVSFGRALAVGLLIMCVANVCYTATWEVIFFRYHPDTMEKYAAHVIAQSRADGRSEADIAKQRAQLAHYAEMYKNPVINSGMTFVEPLPVGLIVSLISAGALSRRRRNTIDGTEAIAPA